MPSTPNHPTEPIDESIPPLVITIDGPAGAGKTTVSKILAQKLRYRYVDTGALYRAVAFCAQQKGIADDDDPALEALCNDLQMDLVRDAAGLRVVVNGDDITDHIRTPEITMKASAVSARPCVRRFLLSVQRRLGQSKRVVFEGRDMGTVVFPEADIKFFLDASLKTRARRRYMEMSPESAQNIHTVQSQMQQRDQNDSQRTLAPLKAAVDAVKIDSDRLSAAEVVETMLNVIRRRF